MEPAAAVILELPGRHEWRVYKLHDLEPDFIPCCHHGDFDLLEAWRVHLEDCGVGRLIAFEVVDRVADELEAADVGVERGCFGG